MFKIFSRLRRQDEAEVDQLNLEVDEEEVEQPDLEVDEKDVAICFLMADLEKADDDVLQIRLHDLKTLDWSALEKKLKKSNSFQDSPVSGWLMKKKERESKVIEKWVCRGGVRLEDCWTSGIRPVEEDPRFQEAVDDVEGNLVRLSKHPYVVEVKEFKKTMPNCNNRTLIGIYHEKIGEKQGSVEIIDGAHRLVAMWKNGMRKTDMFLGKPTAGSHTAMGTVAPKKRSEQ